MKNKKSVVLLSLIAVPAAIAALPDGHVQAAPQEKIATFSGSWVNPHFIYEGKNIEGKVATVNGVATAIPIVATSFEELKQAVYTNLRQYNTEFSIKYVGDTSNLEADLGKVYADLLKDDTIIYESGTISKSQYGWSFTSTEANITFKQSYLTTAQQEQVVTERVQEITKQIITTSMTNLEKIKAINDYVVLNTTYSTETTVSPHAAYAILNEGAGVCQAYALLTYRLLKEAGINAKYVTGNAGGGPHAWNLVELDGKWYHLDATWNDPVFKANAGDRSDYVHYKYFLLSDEDIKKDHTIDNMDYPKATDNKYRPLHSMSTPVQVGSEFYFPNINKDNEWYKVDLENLEAGLTQVSDTWVHHLVVVKNWLYFSDYSNGMYFSKMKLDGSEKSIVKSVAINGLKLDGNDLVYITEAGVTERMQVIDPEEENKAAAQVVTDLIAAINEAAPNFIELVANARVAYDGLTAGQKDYVTNLALLEDAELKVQQENTAVNNIIQKIAQLNELDEQFHTKVAEARAIYDALSTDLQARISNLSTLTTAEQKVIANIAKAEEVEALISVLNTNDAAYVAATVSARNAYNLLTAQQRQLVAASSLQVLEAAEAQKAVDEAAIFDVNYQLELLTDTVSNFKTIVPELRVKYGALTPVQKALITKLDVLTDAEATYTTYEQQAATMETAITALDEASATFYADVQAVNNEYNDLNLAQQEFVLTASKDKLQAMLVLASENLNAAQAVIDQVMILNVTNTNYLAEVEAARTAYDALTAIQQMLVTNRAKLTTEEQVVRGIQDAVAKINLIPETSVDLIANYTVAQAVYSALSVEAKKHVSNYMKLESTAVIVAAANDVEQKIATLKTSSTGAEVAAVRASYTALAPLAQALVTNIVALEAAELRVQQEANQIQANIVIAQITALQPVDASFIAKYEAAKAAYDALTAAQQAYVTNYADLTAAEAGVAKVQDVITAIAEVSTVATYKVDALAAQTQYDDLDAALKIAVTNAAKLTAIATNITAAEQVEQKIAALTTASTIDVINEAKADYDALNELQKQLVTNYSTISTVENEVKAATVETLIANLSETAESFIADVTKAREAYEVLTADQQKLVQNVAQLEAAEVRVADMIQSEQEVAGVIQLIAKINDTAANFVAAFEAAEQDYANLTPEQQAKVTNVADLAQYEQKITDYEDVAASFVAQVTSIDTASVEFITEVEYAQSQYATFNAAQATFISAETKTLLEQYVADIAAIREVEEQLLSLNALSTTYYAEVAAAEAAYASFASNYAALLSMEARKKLEEAIAHVAADKLAAQQVIDAITALSTASTEEAVQTARAQYNALTANQKQLVTNVAKLVEVENALANAENDSGATGGGSSSADGDSSSNNDANSSGSGSGSSSGGSNSSNSSDDDDDSDDRANSSGSPNNSSSGSSGGSSSAPNDKTLSVSDSSSAEGETTNAQTPTQPAVQVGDNGTSYSVVVPPATPGGQAQPTTITMSENVRITVPQTAIPTAASTASIAMGVDVSEANVIQFTATIDEAPAKFATYIEFEVANLPDGSVILRRDENGNLSAVPFTIVDGKHVIKTRTSGEFVVSTAKVTFSDVANDGHKEYIDELAKRHIVTGVDAENFDPNAGMTRAQFSAMIARAMNLEAEQETKFTDVKGKWYEASVQALAEAGIVTGKSEEIFDPAQVITRQQTGVMIERLLKHVGVQLPEVNVENVPFTDFDKIPASYQPSVALMYQLGIFTGKDDGTFDASGELTRSQMTKVLYKALQLAEML